MPQPMEMVKLKNGAEVPYAMVTVVNMSLKGLITPTNNPPEDMQNACCFYDIVMASRDKNYIKEIFTANLEKLKKIGLVQESNQIHEYIRDVVVNSTEGDGLDMKLVSPFPTPMP